jgi:hypothetical protein
LENIAHAPSVSHKMRDFSFQKGSAAAFGNASGGISWGDKKTFEKGEIVPRARGALEKRQCGR